MNCRVLSIGAGVIQICWIAPGPSISATVNVLLALIRTDGETFQVRPRSRAAPWPVPSVAMPPFPFSPLKFSGLIDRDCASESRERVPRCISRPSKRGTGACARTMPQPTKTVSTVQKPVRLYMEVSFSFHLFCHEQNQSLLASLSSYSPRRSVTRAHRPRA